jgi:hypothetical protein
MRQSRRLNRGCLLTQQSIVGSASSHSTRRVLVEAAKRADVRIAYARTAIIAKDAFIQDVHNLELTGLGNWSASFAVAVGCVSNPFPEKSLSSCWRLHDGFTESVYKYLKIVLI